MREMKDSGIEWIGEIPYEWEVYHYKYIVEEKIDNRGRTPDINENDIGIPVIELDAIGSRNPDFDRISKYISEESYDKFIRNDLKRGDVLFGTVGSVGKSSILETDDYCCIAQNVVGYRFNSKQVSLFWYYYFQSESFRQMYMQFNKGNIQSSIKISDMERGNVCVPPIDEQKKIADFLDEKCKEIDALTSDIQKQIETLEQYKKSVITEAVTKGLNPDVEMKDSGVEWIGEIPVTWNVIRLKYASWLKGRIGWQGLRSDEFLDDETLPYLITGTDFVDGYVNWETCVHISEDRFMQDLAIHIEEDDLLITKDGTIGKVAVARNCPDKVSLNSGVFIIRNRGKYKYYDRYMYYLIKSNQFLIWYDLSNTGNSTIKHLNQEKFYNFLFTYPCYYEQQEIADYLDKKCSDIDSIISDKKKQLEIVAEYKKSLIYEYVTGKKEIKER